MMLALAAQAQEEHEPVNTRAEFEQRYQERIKLETIDGVYIPKDLSDAFAELDKRISAESRAKFKGADEQTVVKKLYFSLGRWISYNWGFYEGSRLSEHIKQKFGLSHPDDMAVLIMTTYHRSLTKKPIEPLALAQKLKAKRLAELEERKQ